jgi:light-regulated signal transduction histidine kinase (bacteriophytochrome)
LRTIYGFSKSLYESYSDKLDQEGKHYLQRILAGCERMSELIEDLLQLSRLTRKEIKVETVKLSDLAVECLDELRRQNPERKVSITVAPEVIVKGDAQLLRAVMENLFGNAWKFTGKKAKAQIEFGTSIQEGKQVYFVRDNGAGFDMKYADKLFGVFQRLHSQDEFPGTGVGLASVRRIINRHGGKIWAQAEEGKGATFYFTL